MAQLGRYNQLTVTAIKDHGVMLDGGQDGEILLPSKEVPEDCTVGTELEVFIYQDASQTLIATAKEVAAQVGEVAMLRVMLA